MPEAHSSGGSRSPVCGLRRILGRIAVLLVLAQPGSALAQAVPALPPGMTPEQAAQLLQQRPDLGRLVRQRLQQSGLTPDQIRARLRSAGYPSNLLDAYLAPDSVAAEAPNTDMVQAMSILGLATFTTSDSLLLSGDTLALRRYRDSLRVDSLARADSIAMSGRPLPLFGLDVFRQASTRFQPIVTGPVDESYRLGPGDLLVLILTGAVELAHSDLEVTREGFILIPRVGQIYVSNLTLGQLRNVLYDRLGRVYSGVTRGPNPRTRFEITVARVRVNTIRVVGEVVVPGTYRVAAAGGVLAALYEAGGISERGNFRAVEVRRGATLVGRVDVYDYLLNGTMPQDLLLADGDVVFVPVRGARVKIAGEVLRPAVYEVKEGETLRDLVQIAGGLTPTAATGSATIDRVLPPEERREPGRVRTVLTVPLAAVLRGDQAVPLYSGDSITVFRVLGPRRNQVTVRGNVWQPGTYSLDQGMRLSDLLTVAGGLRPATYAQRAQILRTYPDSTRRLLGVALDNGDGRGSDDPMLQEWDEVTVYAESDFLPERYVAVFGAVRKQGLVPFADSMTLRDAVLLAGGLRDDAYVVEAEVSRMRPYGVGEGDSLALTFRVPLDSSYLLRYDTYVERRVGSARVPDVILHPYDNVFVRRQPGWEAQRNVVVTGEVRFPGRYTLVTKDERLASVISRAGGLTGQAYAGGIRFFRPEGSAGRIGVDLPSVLRNPRHRDNIIMAAGDSVHIPAFIPTVRVEGAVNSPASVPHVPGRSLSYYVQAAGGFSRLADKGGTFVQQPNGLIQKGRRPEPGAVVVVPARDPSERGIDFVALFTGLAQLVAGTATIIVVLVKS